MDLQELTKKFENDRPFLYETLRVQLGTLGIEAMVIYFINILEAKQVSVEPEVMQKIANIKGQFEWRFGISKHHEEQCKKALEQFESDMKSIKCDTGEQGVLNPMMIQALTFYRYYGDIIDWIESNFSA